MKTIIVHPKDTSTEFLSVIYKDMTDYLLVDYFITKKDLRELLSACDRAIFLGHGSQQGLFDFSMSDYVVDESYVDILRGMKNNIYIWCNADVFVDKFELSGFYTGMIISDMDEAKLYNVKATIEDVDNSNINFANSIKENAHCSPKLMVENVKIQYDNALNEVIGFNTNNIHYKL